MDNRKNNGGHSTKGKAGRKPKADEIALIETMDAVMAPKVAWEALAKLAKSGDVPALKVWLSYRLGLPKQSMEVKHEGDVILNFTKAHGCEPLTND